MSTIIVQTTVAETSYLVETTVEDTTYQIAVSTARGPIGPQGPQGAKGDKGDTGPAGLNWRMVWDAGTQYAIDDAVYYSGSSYYAVAVPAVGTAPDPASQSPWMELAIMGQKGDKGDTGDPGPAGAGVPDTTGATTGEVVRYNGTTTEWHQLAAADITGLGTAATADTGTTSGTVPVLNANGRLDMARLASGAPDGTKFVRDDGTLAAPSAGLTYQAGSLASAVTLNSGGTTIWTLSLGVGTWLVEVGVSLYGSGQTQLQATAGTGSPALSGQRSAQADVTSSSAEASLRFIAVCSTASTVVISGNSGAGGVSAVAVTHWQSVANASGYTAVKIT